MTSVLTSWWDAWIRGQHGLRSAMRLGNGARFPTGSIWATMQTAGSSSWANPSMNEIAGQSSDCELRRSYFLK